ncbi:MAG: YaiI/YqxD family protein [Nitrospirota bacterium]|nr:YaiI/YqxD family protein [Nitrospirota bacterium]
MRIYVDADACPKVVKEILFRAAERTGISLTIVANKALWVPSSPLIERIVVGAGLDVADQWISEHAEPRDLVVTADIPLAAKVIAKGGHAISPHGEVYDDENIQERLSVRDFMAELRSGGVVTGGPSTFSVANRQAFANALNRFLSGTSRK